MSTVPIMQCDTVLVAQESEIIRNESPSPHLIKTIPNEYYRSPSAGDVEEHSKNSEPVGKSDSIDSSQPKGNENRKETSEDSMSSNVSDTLVKGSGVATSSTSTDLPSSVIESRDIIGHALSLAQASPQTSVLAPSRQVPVLKTQPESVKGEEQMGGDLMIKMAQSRLALLQRHAVSPSMLKPANLASLERIGTDSEGSVYWYDGGRNMYQSPQTSDATALPKESELVLACKSMVQWQNKLKQLRLSCTESDSRLAQNIKENFISRVRVATQRKPREVSQTPNSSSSAPTHFPTVTSTITSKPTDSTINPAHLIQTGIQQGSILVLPQSQGFPGLPLLPVFANTAVIMPQSVPQSIDIETHISTSVSIPGKDGGVEKDVEQSRSDTAGDAGNGAAEQARKDSPDITVSQSLPSLVMNNQQQPLGIVLAAPRPAAPTASEANEIKIQPNPYALAALSGHHSSQKTSSHPFSAVQSGMFMLCQVEKEVELGCIDKVTKSMEILEEIPIRKVEVAVEEEKKKEEEEKEKRKEREHMECTVKSDNVARQLVDETSNSTPAKTMEENVHEHVDEPSTVTSAVSTHGRSPSESSAIAALAELAHGRTTQEVMSAKLLLSLQTAENNSSTSTHSSASPQSGAQSTAQSGVQSTPQPGVQSSPSSSSTSSATTRRIKKTPRKQTPVASAKASNLPSTHPRESSPSLRMPPESRVQDHQQKTSASSQLLTPNQLTPRSREFTSEEFLGILEPKTAPHSDGTMRKRPTSRGRGRGRGRGGGGGGGEGGRGGVTDLSKQTPKLHQLASGMSVTGRPMKEYVIETDSSDSSSGSESSSGDEEDAQSPSSTSSSSASSDDSGEYQVETGRSGRGRGRGRGTARGHAGRSRQQQDRRPNQERRQTVAATRGGQRGAQKQQGDEGRKRGRGEGRRGRLNTSHPLMVSVGLDLLPTDVSILADKSEKRKQKRISLDNEDNHDHDNSSHDEESTSKSRHVQGAEPPSDVPVDLTTYYSTQGGVDWDTLSELTSAVGKSDDTSGGLRSKRKCVRVREEMSRLQEILELDSGITDSKLVSGSRGGRGRTGRAKLVSDPYSRRPKSRSNVRSQFTHKRRRRRKPPEEEEALWQPAKPQNSSEKLKPVYIFSTNMANKAAEAVWKGKYESIIHFHKAQPRGPGFLRLPQNAQPKKRLSTTGSESESHPAAKQTKRRGGRVAVTGVRRSGRLAGIAIVTEPPQEEEEEEEEQKMEDEESDREEDEEEEEEAESEGSDSARQARRRRSGPGPPSPFTSSHSPPSAVGRSQYGSGTSPRESHGIDPSSQPQDESTKNSSARNQQVTEIHSSSPQTEPHTTTTHCLKSPDSVQTPNQLAKDEDNYTICHGTPEAGKVTEAAEARHMSSGHSVASGKPSSHPQSRPNYQPMDDRLHDHSLWSAGGHYAAPPGAIHGSYPQMYNTKFHAMPYPAAAQGMPAANYPYPMAYHWPHPHAHTPQPWPGGDMFPGALAHGHTSTPISSPSQPHSFSPQQQPTPSSSVPSPHADTRKDPKVAITYNQMGQLVGSMSPAELRSHPQSIQAMRQFGSQPHQHNPTHHFPPHHPNPSSQDPAHHSHAFPYPFEARTHPSMAHLHPAMWQSSQIPHPQLHPMVQPHLPPQGMWPPHHMTHMMQPEHHAKLGGGGGGGGGKGKGGSDGEKAHVNSSLNINQNNSHEYAIQPFHRSRVVASSVFKPQEQVPLSLLSTSASTELQNRPLPSISPPPSPQADLHWTQLPL